METYGCEVKPGVAVDAYDNRICLSSDVDRLSRVQFNSGVLAVCCVHDIAVISGLARV